MLEQLRAAIHAVLGRRAYDMFTREIGDTTILNGMIALVRALHACMHACVRVRGWIDWEACIINSCGPTPTLTPPQTRQHPTQTIFARAADVERGAVQVARSAMGKLHSGMKLGPVRAPNKGMVGISLRYHDGA